MPRRSKKKEPTAWELAKPVLTQDILNGDVPAGIHPDIIRERKTIYKSVPRPNFYNNMKALQKRISINVARAARDKAALKHDNIVQRNRNNVPLASKKPRWDGSRSQIQLKLLMARNDHVGVKSSDLYSMQENAVFKEEGFTLTEVKGYEENEPIVDSLCIYSMTRLIMFVASQPLVCAPKIGVLFLSTL